jgi:carbon-monoxide dehydrogenase small subunit
MKLYFYLNGQYISHDVEPRKRLVEFLHDDLNMLSLRKSCYRGYCGACTVLIDDIAHLSCIMPSAMVQGRRVVTFEGFKETDEYRHIQSALQAFTYSPCEYCYPSKVLSIHSLLVSSPRPGEKDIIDMLKSHACSCDLYRPLIKSVHMAGEIREEENE